MSGGRQAAERLWMGALLRAIELLIVEGHLDRATLRPPAESTSPPSSAVARVSGRQLMTELEAYIERHGLARSRVSRYLFNGPSAIARISRARLTPQRKTVERVRAFIAEPPPPRLRVHPAGGVRVADVGGVTGAALAAEIDALIAKHGLSKARVGMHLYGNTHGVDVLRQSHPRQATVAKVRALLADPPLDQLRPKPPGRPRRRPAEPFTVQGVRGIDPEAEEIVEVHECGGCAPPVVTKRVLSFEEQLARVERGEVGLAPNIKIGRPDPSGTLGGVTGEINL